MRFLHIINRITNDIVATIPIKNHCIKSDIFIINKFSAFFDKFTDFSIKDYDLVISETV